MSESAPTNRAHSIQGEGGQSEALFVASSQPRVGFGGLVLFVVAAILVFGGFYLMGLAFSVQELGFWLFAAGLALDTIGFWLVFGIVPNRR